MVLKKPDAFTPINAKQDSTPSFFNSAAFAITFLNKLIFNPSFLNKNNEVVYKPNVSILIQEEEPLKNEIESFLNCIQYGETPLTDIKEAINVQIVLNKIENKLIKKYG